MRRRPAALARPGGRLAPAGGALVMAALVLAGCQSGAPLRTEQHPPLPPLPAAPHAAHYRIDPTHSQVLILVYRAGPLAALGHNHVIAVRDLSGQIVLPRDAARGAFALAFPVAALSVDEPRLRAAQGSGFRQALSPAEVAGTRTHMLGASQLQARHYPLILLRSQRLHRTAHGWRALTLIEVRDHKARVQVPVELQRSASRLVASGRFEVTQRQLGLTPYSIALGALRVAETLRVQFRLVAEREPAPTG